MVQLLLLLHHGSLVYGLLGEVLLSFKRRKVHVVALDVVNMSTHSRSKGDDYGLLRALSLKSHRAPATAAKFVALSRVELEPQLVAKIAESAASFDYIGARRQVEAAALHARVCVSTEMPPCLNVAVILHLEPVDQLVVREDRDRCDEGNHAVCSALSELLDVCVGEPSVSMSLAVDSGCLAQGFPRDGLD